MLFNNPYNLVFFIDTAIHQNVTLIIYPNRYKFEKHIYFETYIWFICIDGVCIYIYISKEREN